MAFPYCYVRVGRGWLSTVQSYFLLHVVVLSLTYSNNFLEYCEYDSEVGEHGISCCVRGVHEFGLCLWNCRSHRHCVVIHV